MKLKLSVYANYGMIYRLVSNGIEWYQKYVTIEEFENTEVEDEYQYLYKKDSELRGGNITVENESVVEYGNEFLYCKIIHSKQ